MQNLFIVKKYITFFVIWNFQLKVDLIWLKRIDCEAVMQLHEINWYNSETFK